MISDQVPPQWPKVSKLEWLKYAQVCLKRGLNSTHSFVTATPSTANFVGWRKNKTDSLSLLRCGKSLCTCSISMGETITHLHAQVPVAMRALEQLWIFMDWSWQYEPLPLSVLKGSHGVHQAESEWEPLCWRQCHDWLIEEQLEKRDSFPPSDALALSAFSASLS